MYWAIKHEGKTLVLGPFDEWQDAVLKAHGIISTGMEIKCLGNNAWWLQKKRWLDDQIRQVEGWFRPYIPSSDIGMTMLSVMALGPREMSELLKVIAMRIRDATTLDEIDKAYEESIPLIRFVGVEIQRRYSELIELHRERVRKGT